MNLLLLVVVSVFSNVLTVTLARPSTWLGLPYCLRILLSGDDSGFMAEASELSQRLTRLEAQDQGQARHVTELKIRLESLMETTVSFTAAFSAPRLEWLHEQQVLVPDKVLFNTGEGYDPGNGLFTAPRPGLYAFSVTVSRLPLYDECVVVDLYRGHDKRLTTASERRLTTASERRLTTASERRLTTQSHWRRLNTVIDCPSLLLRLSTLKAATRSGLASVRLQQGDTVHLQLRAGTALSGHRNTSWSGRRVHG